MTQASFAKRRANPRFSFFAEAEVILQDGTSVLGQISELSSRGCYIDLLQPIPIGAELRLCHLRWHEQQRTARQSDLHAFRWRLGHFWDRRAVWRADRQPVLRTRHVAARTSRQAHSAQVTNRQHTRLLISLRTQLLLLDFERVLR